MAIFHDNLKYHDDNVGKHEITREEIEFLKELQKEMNTQDHVGQANPRYWVIKGTEKMYGIETGYEDGADLYDEDGCYAVATDLETAKTYIEEELLDEINSCDGIERKLEMELGLLYPCLNVKWMDDDFEESKTLENMEQVAEWLNDLGYSYSVSNYSIVPKIYQNTMALTQKDMEDHLRKNHYHYSDDAHTYAMTAWREPRIEKLYKILQEVDWETLEKSLIPTEVTPYAPSYDPSDTQIIDCPRCKKTYFAEDWDDLNYCPNCGKAFKIKEEQQ